MHRISVFCSIFLLATAVVVVAQTRQYKFSHLDVSNGLSHNEVLCFFKDSRGFMWIGTFSGLNRYDGYSLKVFRNDVRDTTTISYNYISKVFDTPDGRVGVNTLTGLNFYNFEKDRFERNASEFFRKYNIKGNAIADVVKDGVGNFWFITPQNGITYYDAKEKKSLLLTHRVNDTTSLASDAVSAFAQDVKGNHWVIHRNGVLEKIAVGNETATVVFRSSYLQKKNKGALRSYVMSADDDGDLWISTPGDPQGVYYFNVSTGTFKHFHSDSKEGKLNANLVSSIVQDNEGLIWVGTDHGGINVINKLDFSVQYILHREDDEKSLSQNSVSLYKDYEGIIWAGTYKKGVSYYHENIIRFPSYKYTPNDTRGLPFGDVNRFIEDHLGNLWIGTNGGGLIYFNRSTETYKQFKHEPGNPNSLASDVIVSLCMDHEKKLWIGTYFGGLNCYDGKKFVRYTHDPSNPRSLSGKSVWEIFEDSEQRLWVGLMDEGLELFDRPTQSFSHFRHDDVNSVRSTYISAIAEDSEGNLYFGTSNGLDVWMKSTGRFVHYVSESNNPNSLSNNRVLDIREDSKGRMWIGTHGGLNLFDRKTNTFTVFTEADGLPHLSVLTILEDASGNLWLGTPNNLSKMTLTPVRATVGKLNPKFASSQPGKTITTQTEKGIEVFSVAFQNYNEADGLPGKQLNENAALKTRRGELIFGGPNGFTIFKPEQLGMNKNLPRVVFTDFQLYQKSIKPGEKVEGKVILEKSISETERIILSPGKDFFTVEFSALSFFHPEKNQYQYKLQGLSEDWLKADGESRKITFTHLNPGDYTLLVKVANNEGLWNETPAMLKITILPPFWKTHTAFVLYVLFIVAALLVTRKIIQQREKMKFTIEQERREAMRMHELDMMKIKFFTNVSHEFRTPLTLILTPLEKMMKQAADAGQRNQYNLIHRNARRLLNLVNQLLDFRKLEVQGVQFYPSEGDIVQFVRDTVYSFSDLSEKKDINLDFQSSLSTFDTVFDADKLEKILFNLLSNAFKFTPGQGSVTVRLSLDERDNQKWICMDVEDTGIGIPGDKKEKVFDRFFQSDLPHSMMNQGSGIGLSITKEFVRAHGGSITVESELEKGTCFTVRLPVKEALVHSTATDLLLSEREEELAVYDEGPGDGEVKAQKPVVLLVEDNEDFRFYLKDNLKMSYTVLEAKDGKEAWKHVLSSVPDLIVSDVMMPRMNGIELCKKIKEDQRVSHIPVILLTARSSEEQKLEGIETGADDYITKPFSFEILISRIRSLIRQREKLHRTFPKQLDIKASELNITSLDEKFIQNAIRCVESNVTSANFSVEELSRELGISRAHLYKKILSLTGKSPLEFIRTIRLQQAAQLLEKSQLTVSEIAYQVGFNNTKYFAKYFKDQYNMLPSVYAASKRGKN